MLSSPTSLEHLGGLSSLPCKMAWKTCFMLSLPLALMLLFLGTAAAAQGLQVGFYSKTCPRAELIVREETTRIMSVAPSLAGPLLRMHFHDCFVRGCDGSVLLNSTGNNNVAEKDAPPNQSLRGFGVIDRVKARLEKACPQTVSCADILALVARDVVFLIKGPYWQVPTGRRDGRVSIAQETRQLPPSNSTISSLISSFQSKGLSVKDLVVLSGGHTLGTSHCTQFSNRIYNYTGKGDTDPNLDRNYIPKLRAKCAPNDNTTLVEMDPGSFRTFDAGYYTHVSKRRGLFESDAALLQNSQTRAYVLRHARGAFAPEFFKDFGDSMISMGNIGVLTGTKGEIRKTCAFVN
ncbi:peroxidase 1-like [Phoenix dactylifera]|uniref:Peroxidase n=1 Tax=Phoenix dactylifera TaxID=42345 RepID=A0A8B7CKP0_PHODC|nr:peroxidase 1-like [Phoenix dactylifera]